MARQLYAILPNDLEQLRIGPPGSNHLYMRVLSSFDYPRLPGPDYIRLLHLERASEDSSGLRGSLKVHKLDALCEYEAISYAWGDYPEFDRHLFLDDEVLKISRNLYAALVAYSSPDRTRTLWADAICINQADTAEKTQQVAIMADIYGRAKRVQAWLAPASNYTTEAMMFMTQLASKAESFGISNEVDQPRWCFGVPSVNIRGEEVQNLISDAIKAHVDYLVSRSWFSRVWIVQEVTLARELIVSCGQSTMDWTAFARALEVLRGALRHVPYGEEVLRLQGLKPAWELVRQRDVFRMFDQQQVDRDHHVMANLLGQQMRCRDCSDDRDRIYAMLAMTKSPYPMMPDYDRTVAEVYTEFTRRYSPVKHLYLAGLCRRKDRTNLEDANATEDSQPRPINIANRDYLPSWVPEFRPSLASEWAWPLNGAYCTARQAPFYFVPLPEMLSAMAVTGTVFDIIVSTTQIDNKKHSPYCMYDPAQCFDPTGEVFQHVLLKALGVASRPFGTDGEIAFVFPNYLTNILITNLLFVTTAGHLGLAPRDVRFGDLVAIFNGCDTPYVVRLARGAEHGENLFEALQVVGPCYLHGIMNEEIFMDCNTPQFSRLKWT